MSREADIERKVREHAEALGFLVFKFTSPGKRAVPDRVFISPRGHHLYIEFKAPGKRPTPLQFRMIEKLRKQNVAAWWTNNLERGLCMIADFYHSPHNFNATYR